MDKTKRRIYYYDEGLNTGFLVLGPCKIFDPHSLVGKRIITSQDYNALIHTIQMRKFETAKGYLDKILSSIEEPFGGQKMYLWISSLNRKTSRKQRIVKKKDGGILKFMSQSHVSFLFKREISLGKWIGKDAETLAKHLRNHVIPNMLSSSDPMIYIGRFNSKYRDFISLYVSHKFGWV